MDERIAATASGSGSPLSDRRAVILVVDDSPVQVELLRRALDRAGYRVIAASNGAEGLASARTNHPVAVVSDINMPVMDGFALCHAIRCDDVLKVTPVILLTMLSDLQDVIRGLNAGADAYVTKPFDAPTLVSRLESLLAHPPAAPPSLERRKVRIRLAGETYLVDAHGPRMLNLLVSTYENAVVQTRDLVAAQEALEDLNQHLEQRVLEQTAALQDSERRFRTLIEDGSDLVVVINAGGAITYVSPSIKRIGGYEIDEVLGPSVLEFVHPEDRDNAARDIAEVLRNPAERHVTELRFRHKDNTWITLESIERNALADPAVNGIVMNLRDITERKRAEMALRQSEEKFSKAFLTSPYAITITRPEDGQFLDVNDAFLSMSGFRREEALASSSIGAGLWVDESDRDRVVAALRAGRTVSGEEYRFRMKNGEFITGLFSAQLLRLGDAPFVLSSINDITERERAKAEREKLEEQLRASQKMEAIGSLAGGVAHDFNNLLSVILSYTEFATEGMRDGDPLKDDLLEVKKAGERAAALTRQLLAFSRKQVLQPVALSLNQIATGVEKMLRRILGEDIDLVQTLAPDLGLTLVDPGQIEQVLMNLVVNARDAMPEGGRLTIETSNVEIDEEYAARHVAVTPGSYVQMAVSDTGCGMDEQTRARIFEPFFTTKEKGKGTGLGLSTVYGIVKQSGGNIWVYTELGHGTTIKIYLPRARSATTAMAIRPVTITTRSNGTETILVVEDEEALRQVAKRSLEGAGYRVLTASDGNDALSVSAQHAGDIHLLLTDVVMPRMGGRAVAHALSNTRPMLKVVYMSGYTDNAIVHHGVLDPGTHFLGKPFTSAGLVQKVREVLDMGVPNLADGQDQAVRNEAEKEEKQEKPLLDRDALRGLSPNVLAGLRNAVIAARYGEIVKIIETIRMTEPEVATGLRRMADLFDYDRMRDLLSDRTESPHG